MKRTITLLAGILSGMMIHAQVFWTEDFGSGCSQGTVASSYTGTNGAWSIAATGTNDQYANQFFVSATEAGMGVNNCGNGCLSVPSLLNRTLHVGNVAIAALSLPADQGAAYFSGGACGLGYCALTNRRAESPVINCTGKSNMTLGFLYMENGSGTSDNATLWYFDGSVWAQLFDIAKTPTTCSPQGRWTLYSITLPASANNNANVKIGFGWTNNDDGVGTDPSFAVDDITVFSSPTGINENAAQGISIYSNENNIIIKSESVYKIIAVTDMLGSKISFTQSGNTISLNTVLKGICFVQLEVNGVRITKKVMMQ